MTDLELDSLDQRVKDLGDKAELEGLRAKIHSIQCGRDIAEITDALNKMVDDSQEEVDLLTQENNTHSNQIKAMEDADYPAQLEGIVSKVEATKEQLNTMDAEHHKAIDELTGKVSEQTDKFEETKAMLDGIIKHQLISEEDYLALGTPDDDVLYFTFEE